MLIGLHITQVYVKDIISRYGACLEFRFVRSILFQNRETEVALAEM